MRETLTISDAAAARVLAAPRQRRLLLLLVDEARSLSELSRLTHAGLSLLHHHVQTFLRLGLVRVEREERRAGAPMKLYRATARQFFVPAELWRAEAADGLRVQLQRSLAQSLAASLRGALYFHDGQGPRMRLVQDSSHRGAVMELWLQLELSDTAAAALADELRALVHRYRSGGRKTQRRYLFHVALALGPSGSRDA